jgi:small GTP-binding protein
MDGSMGGVARPERMVVLTLIGRVNVGKSTLCNAILRRELAAVDPRAGWTKEITLYPVSEELAVADTPGLDDPNPAVAERAFDFVGHSDLFLHLHNLDEGVSHPACEALLRLKAARLPLAVVFNKSDLVAEAVRAEAVRRQTQALGAEGLPVFATSAVTGDGLAGLSAWLEDQVARRGDELVWARVTRHARPVLEAKLDGQVADAILRYSLAAGGVGAVPVPLADIPVLLGIQLKLAHAIGKVYGIEMSRERLREVVGVIVGGVVMRQLGRQAAKLIPGLGWALSGAVAFGGTYGLGKSLQAYYRGGMRLEPEQLREIYRQELAEGQVRYREAESLRRDAEAGSGGGEPKES